MPQLNASSIKRHSATALHPDCKNYPSTDIAGEKNHTIQTKPWVVSKHGEEVNRTSGCRCRPGPLILARSCYRSTLVADMVTVRLPLHSVHSLAPSTTATGTQGPEICTATPFPKPRPHVLPSSNVAPADRNLDGSTSGCPAAAVACCGCPSVDGLFGFRRGCLLPERP